MPTKKRNERTTSDTYMISTTTIVRKASLIPRPKAAGPTLPAPKVSILAFAANHVVKN